MAWLPLNSTRQVRAQQILAGIRQVYPQGTADSPRACVIGLMMACAEAGLENPASYAVPASIQYDHDWIAAGDHLSVGIQQAQPWWGSLYSRMTPPLAVQNFIHGQPGVPGLTSTNWRYGSLGQAVQNVQKSAYPDGSNYAVYEAFAWYLYNLYSHTAPAQAPPVQPTWNDKLPVISTADINHKIHQPSGRPDTNTRVVFRAAAYRGCGNVLGKLARKGLIDSGDHAFAVASVRAVQHKLGVDQTGVFTVDELHYLGGTTGSHFHATS